MKSLEDAFALNLKACRELKGMSQADLSRATGISPTYISYYEFGYAVPKLETIETLAKGLDIDPLILLNKSIFYLSRDQLIYMGHIADSLKDNNYDFVKALTHKRNRWDVADPEFMKINHDLRTEEKNQVIANLILPFLQPMALKRDDRIRVLNQLITKRREAND
ncbi:MAG: helix-turn-helix transcriptional regulator [Lactobacillus sp.]|nr:helix-turn-helix transcriptional regulator [Lactobacillus sp.]